MAERVMVRILDPTDEFHLSLGLVMKEDDERFGLWLGGHAEDFVHWVPRSSVEEVPGTWHQASSKGAWFIAESGGN